MLRNSESQYLWTCGLEHYFSQRSIQALMQDYRSEVARPPHKPLKYVTHCYNYPYKISFRSGMGPL